MARKIGTTMAAITAALCLVACGATDTSEGHASAEAAGSESSSADVVTGLDASDVVVLRSDSGVPNWYTWYDKGGESSTTGDSAFGACNDDWAFYYPIRRQDNPKDAYGYYASAAVEGVGEGILLSMVDEYAASGIRPYGVMVWVNETTQKTFSIDQVAEFYFIPDAELGADPSIAKELAPEIGLCAYEQLP